MRCHAPSPSLPPLRPSSSTPPVRESLSFAVSNALGRGTRARITVVPEGNTKRDWLTVAGESERDFASDGTQKVTIRVNAPAGTPQGAYTFHPLVSSVTNPDEEYADGPTVTFEVAASAPPKKPFPWWIVAVAGGVLVIAVGAIVVFSQLQGGAKLHEACDDAEKKCSGKLTCVKKGAAAECLGAVDVKCKAKEDCESGTCSGGKCAEPPPGVRCQADAGCPPSQKCIEARPGVKACLLRSERACINDIDCASGFCTDKKTCSRDDGRCTQATKATDCRTGVTDCVNDVCVLVQGQTCTQNNQCVTGFLQWHLPAAPGRAGGVQSGLHPRPGLRQRDLPAPHLPAGGSAHPAPGPAHLPPAARARSALTGVGEGAAMAAPKPAIILLVLAVVALVAFFLVGVGLGAGDKPPPSRQEKLAWRQKLFGSPPRVARAELSATGCQGEPHPARRRSRPALHRRDPPRLDAAALPDGGDAGRAPARLHPQGEGVHEDPGETGSQGRRRKQSRSVGAEGRRHPGGSPASSRSAADPGPARWRSSSGRRS